jgi:hypothetical protein
MRGICSVHLAILDLIILIRLGEECYEDPHYAVSNNLPTLHLGTSTYSIIIYEIVLDSSWTDIVVLLAIQNYAHGTTAFTIIDSLLLFLYDDIHDWGVRVRILVGSKNVHFSMSSRQALRPTHSPTLRLLGFSFAGVKQQGFDADHSPPTSAKVKKTWPYTIHSSIRLHGIVLSELSTGTTLTLHASFYRNELWRE